MQWFRLYNNVRHNPKVQNLSPQLFRFWINLLCLANDQPERGVIANLDIIATDLGMRRDVVVRFTLTLREALLLVTLTNGSLKVHDWDTLQRPSDNSTERVKRHREKSYVNEKNPPCNGFETKCNALDSDTDTEKNNTPPPAGAHARETIVGANPPTLPSTPKRTPEDQAEVDAACALLGSTLGSEHLAMQIGQQSDIPGMVEIEGWKFHEAAKRLLDPAKARSLRGNWKYYLGIVRGLRDDERPNSARAAPSPSTNGHATPRRTYEEITEDYAQRMREEREKNKPKVDPEYAKQLAQYNEIMRKFHERRL